MNRALEKAKEVKAEGAEKLKETIGEKILSHEGALQKTLEKVPEQAKEGIKNAIEVSRQSFENAIQAMTGEKKEELEKRAEEIKLAVEEKIGNCRAIFRADVLRRRLHLYSSNYAGNGSRWDMQRISDAV